MRKLRRLLILVGDATASLYVELWRLTLGYVHDVASALAFAVNGSEELGAPLPTPKRTRHDAGALVLEAESGGCALGAFVVENRLERPVSAAVLPSPFVDEAGREVTPTIGFEPGEVRLLSGEKTIVRFLVKVDDTLRTGVDYRATVTLAGLTEHGIPLVLRRRRRSRAG